MKIDNSPFKKTGELGISASPARSGKAAQTGGSEKIPSDSVTLSAKAQALSAQSASDGVFDLSKVNEIKEAIASGRFQINPERIADGLIDSVKDMISVRK